MASSVPIRLSDAVDLYDEAIQRVFDGQYKAEPETYKLLCDVGNSDIYIEKRSAFTGFSMARQLGENEAVQYESPEQGFDQSWTQRQFALGFAVTKMLWQFGQHGTIQAMPARLADAMSRKRESDVQDYLYNGLAGNTSYTDDDGNVITITGGDGLALFTKTHTREDGGTAINNFVYDGIKCSAILEA